MLCAGADAAGAAEAEELTAPLPKPIVMTKTDWHPHNLTDLVRTELRMAADGSVRMRPGREHAASFAAFQARRAIPRPQRHFLPAQRPLSPAPVFPLFPSFLTERARRRSP